MKFLPPNVTAICQPMDQGPIQATKMRYKKKLMLELLLANENIPFEQRLKEITLKQSIDWLVDAWQEVTPETMINSWKKLVEINPINENVYTDYEMLDEAEFEEEDVQEEVSSGNCEIIEMVQTLLPTKIDEAGLNNFLQDIFVDKSGETSSSQFSSTDDDLFSSIIETSSSSLIAQDDGKDEMVMKFLTEIKLISTLHLFSRSEWSQNM